MDISIPESVQIRHLKDELAEALPQGFLCSLRYIQTPSKPCDTIFSPPPGHDPEKTRFSNHFVTVSIALGDCTTVTPQSSLSGRDSESHVFVLGLEVFVYSTRHLTTIFVSKADTTGYLTPSRPSKTKAIITTFLRWLTGRELEKHPQRKLVISLFARAQAQYLFPGSAEHPGKRPLDDRQLIKWWAHVLDPISRLSMGTALDDRDTPLSIQGYVTIPGYDASELRSYLPTGHLRSDCTPRWKAGDPLEELAEARGVSPTAPPRSLLPRFPDDPKARFMQDLDDEIGLAENSQVTVSPSKRKNGRWNGVTSLKRFWEAMEFRQECSSGRAVGFLWLVITPSTPMDAEDKGADSQGSTLRMRIPEQASAADVTSTPKTSCAKKGKRKALAGPIIPRRPRLKSGSSSLTATRSSLNIMLNAPHGDGLLLTKDGYDKAIKTLLNLDFTNIEAASRSTSKWVAEVCSMCGLSSDWASEIVGNARTESFNRQAPAADEAHINDLGGMIRKKRKAADQPEAGGDSSKNATSQIENAETPRVNILGSSNIRKKPKPADIS